MSEQRTREELLEALAHAEARIAKLEAPRYDHPMKDPATILPVLIDSLGLAVFWKDRDSRYLGGNQRFARVAGLDGPAALLGVTDHDLAWRPEEANFFIEVDQRVMKSGEAELNIEEPQLQDEGRQAWLRTNKIPVRDATGEVIGIIGHFEDITEQRTIVDAYKEDQRTLDRQLAEIHEQMQIIDAQRAEIATLSTPVLEIWDDVLVLPLIGILDERRAQLFTSSLLEAVEQRGARYVIIDVTGAARFDRRVAERLGNGIQATGLLGAECFVTGLSPEIAKLLSEERIDLAEASISRTLKNALQTIVARRGLVG